MTAEEAGKHNEQKKKSPAIFPRSAKMKAQAPVTEGHKIACYDSFCEKETLFSKCVHCVEEN